jgi:hypothetical protein
MPASVYEYTSEQAELIHFYDFYRSALLGQRYNSHKLQSVRRRVRWVEMIAAVTSSGAIVSLAFWTKDPGKTILTILLVISAIASILRSVFDWTQELDLRSRLCSGWLDLYLEMENVLGRVRSHEHANESDRAQMELLCERFRKLNSLDSTRSDEGLMVKLQEDIELTIPPEGLWLPS